MVRGETGARDLSTNVGRRLAGGRSTVDGGADSEDSPLQSKRSSMFQFSINNKSREKTNMIKSTNEKCDFVLLWQNY